MSAETDLSPEPIPRRLSAEDERAFFGALNRGGQLRVLLAVLDDRIDQRAHTMVNALAAELLVTPEQLALFHARQGAIQELRAFRQRVAQFADPHR